MDRRQFLRTAASALLGGLAGCGNPIEGSTPTPLPDDTIRLGPSSPGCPDGDGGEHWGMMSMWERRYNATVTSSTEARLVVDSLANETANDSFTLAEPRIERIAWKGSVIDVTERYGTDDWYLFTPPQTGTDRVGVLVVGGNETRTVDFVVGPC